MSRLTFGTARRIALAYFLAGGVWVLGTDWLWERSGAVHPAIQLVKGLLFVAVGAVLLYAFAARWAREREMTLDDRARLEQRLSVLSKFEAVGQLTAGIAHDFNNLLTAISGNLASYSARFEPGDVPEEVREAAESAERASDLTRQLLAFRQGEEARPERVEVNALIARMTSLLKRLIGERIQVVTDLSPALPAVRADPGRLDQVLMNLAINARDAMPEGGRLRIHTTAERVDEEAARAFPFPFRPGEYVRVDVSDTGVGMDAEMQARIFEPFFTTKPRGVGTGLGLATVYAIVKQVAGHVSVESEPGVGSTFHVYLPQSREPAPAPAQGEETQPARTMSGSETVLVAEDDDAVRTLVTRVLDRRGYRAHGACNGREALELLRREGPFDLLLTDAIMPEMTGVQLIEAARSVAPGLRVLLISGYARSDFDFELPYLAKPFTPDQLVRRLREVLDA